MLRYGILTTTLPSSSHDSALLALMGCDSKTIFPGRSLHGIINNDEICYTLSYDMYMYLI